MMRKFFTTLISGLFFLLIPIQAGQAVTNSSSAVNLYFFYGDGCPHCVKEEVFLEKLATEKDNLKIYYYETWRNQDNARLLYKVAEELNLDVSGVPILIGGDQIIIGYYNDQTTGQKIRELVSYLENNECTDRAGAILGIKPAPGQCEHSCSADDAECLANCGCAGDFSEKKAEMPESINLPFFGTVDIGEFSLPMLTILIAALDGFNPCAMWILLFLISLLLGMNDRKKMWILGGTFIFVSGLVYFLFLSAWLNLFLFLGFIFWIRILIGLVAVGSGFYHLREYRKNKQGTCHVTSNERRRKFFSRLRDVVSQQNFFLALGGIALLAVAVNLVELVCSAGLPAIYTQVLALSSLPGWQYYSYLFLYILVFMLDDLFIFALAMTTLKMQGISSKYSRWSNLIGGLLMLIIGLLLIFKPGWLMFG